MAPVVALCFALQASCLTILCHVSLQIDRGRVEKGGFMSLQSMGSGRIESAFSDMSISSSGSGGFGGGSGFGLSTDIDSFSTKTKGLCLYLSA